MIENYYITGLPINLKELGVIYQPTIKELLLIEMTNKEVVQPFLLHKGIVLGDEDDELRRVLKNFDLFFLSERNLLDSLIISLKILYKTENVLLCDNNVLEQQSIIVDDNIIINRDNYDKLADVVLGMFVAERPKKQEEEKVNLPTEKHRKIWEKMQKSKARKQLKAQMNLCDIINIVCHGSKFFTYKDIVDFTYYQLVTSYKTIMNIDNYNEFTQYKLSTKFDIKTDIKHWTTESKISKVPLVE